MLTDDGAGGSETSFEAAGSVWGAVMVRGMVERFTDDRFDGVVTHRIRLRHRADIAGGWRLVQGLRVFRVLAASDPDNRGRWLDVLAEEEGR
ncbi:phage head closure protein [Breoghania sp.]|uniref:phage head closure protein n=1 Tax=Breoghania sp. TaxID=2065378 RepID=UPI002633D576|nr:phage head closure protein [Breoghania sp.]